MPRLLLGGKAVWKLPGRRPPPLFDVPVPGAVPLDVDTWEDYEAVLSANC